MAVLRRLWLDDFRNYRTLDWEPQVGRLVVEGRNGQGKSNLVEAVAFIGSMTSFRGAPTDVLIRADADRAVLRADVDAGGREVLIEMELVRGRTNRVQVNKQRVARRADLVGLIPVTVFGPDDLELVKAGPGVRRDFLDALLVQLHPRNERLRGEVERVLKQRNALLRSAKGRWREDLASTLEVWNAKLAEVGEQWASARRDLVDRLAPRVDAAYGHLAGTGHPVALRYAPAWLEIGLARALDEARDDEIRRGVTLVGPHRDELDLSISAMAARTHASQGEQRTLALALRIAGHHELAEVRGTNPLLVLDDVFSELDPGRVDALLSLLVADQTFITTASPVPAVDTGVSRWVVDAGTVRQRTPLGP